MQDRGIINEKIANFPQFFGYAIIPKRNNHIVQLWWEQTVEGMEGYQTRNYMDVSENSGTTMYHQIIYFNRVFHYKPSILGYSTPIFGNTHIYSIFLDV